MLMLLVILIQGQLIKTSVVDSMDLKNIAAGMYFLHVITDKLHSVHKLQIEVK